jgi:hypothetical protein
MAQNLGSITLVQPSGDPAPEAGGSFTLEASFSFNGGSGVNAYDVRAEWSTDNANWSIIASTGDLSTATTNPKLNQTDTGNESWTITANTAGTYYVRVTGDGNGGNDNYSIVSGSQLVTVSAVAGPITVSPGATAAVTLAGQQPSLLIELERSLSDTASITGTESPLGEKTISTIDTGETVGGDTSSLDDGSVPGIVSPATAELVLAGQAPTALAVSPVESSDTAAVTGTEAPLFEKTITTLDPATVTTADESTLEGASEAIVTAGAGAVTVTGQAPAVLSTARTQPGAAAVTVTGQAPALESTAQVQPASAAVVVEGLPPATLPTAQALPAAAAVVLAGQAPTVLSEALVAPAQAALIVAGQPASVSTDTEILATVTPAQADLAVAGQAATVASEATQSPSVGTVTVQGQAPDVAVELVLELDIAAGAGAVALAGQQPFVATGTDIQATVQPAQGAVAVAGQAPTVQSLALRAPNSANLNVAGQQPTVSAIQDIQTTVQPGLAALAVAGQAPTARSTAQLGPGAATVTVQGQTPALASLAVLAPSQAAVAVQGLAPSVSTEALTAKNANDTAAVQGAEAPLSSKTISTVEDAVLATEAAATRASVLMPVQAAVVLEGLAPLIVTGETKYTTDTAGLTATEAPLSAKTITTLDGADVTAAATSNLAEGIQVTPLAAALALAGQQPELVLRAGARIPGYADIRLNQGDETRPSVNTLGDNDKASSDTAAVTGTEALLGAKTVVTVDEAQVGAAPTPITTDLWAYDSARPTLVDTGGPFNGLRPAPADLVLEGQQPGVSLDGATGLSPNTRTITLAGQVPVVASTAQVQPAQADLVATGQQPNSRQAQGPEPATITLAGLQPGLAFGTPVNTTDAAGVTATEAPLSLKTVQTVDEGEIGAAETPIATDLWAYDVGRTTGGDVGYPFNAVRPAWAEIRLDSSLQPAVSADNVTGISPQTGSISLGGAQPFAVSQRVATPDPVVVTIGGEAPNVLAQRDVPDAATIRIEGFAPVTSKRWRVYPGAAGVSIQGLRSVIFASGAWPAEASASAAWAVVAGAPGSWTDTSRESGTWTVTAGSSLTWEQTAGAGTTWRT